MAIAQMIPRFLPKGYRRLRLLGEIEKGDYRWSHKRKCYLPVTKKMIGEMVGEVRFIIRKEKENENKVDHGSLSQMSI